MLNIFYINFAHWKSAVASGFINVVGITLQNMIIKNDLNITYI